MMVSGLANGSCWTRAGPPVVNTDAPAVAGQGRVDGAATGAGVITVFGAPTVSARPRAGFATGVDRVGAAPANGVGVTDVAGAGDAVRAGEGAGANDGAPETCASGSSNAGLGRRRHWGNW